mgnify:CR=1 FL=1
MDSVKAFAILTIFVDLVTVLLGNWLDRALGGYAVPAGFGLLLIGALVLAVLRLKSSERPEDIEESGT